MTIHFQIDDESSAPLPRVPREEYEDDLSYRLHYGEIDQTDRYTAASIIHAYETLLLCTNKRANEIRRAYRKHLKENQ